MKKLWIKKSEIVNIFLVTWTKTNKYLDMKTGNIVKVFSLWYIAACDSSWVKIENYEVKYFLILLCLNDSKQRNNGVSLNLFNVLHTFQFNLVSNICVNLSKFRFTDTLLFLGRGCICQCEGIF